MSQAQEPHVTLDDTACDNILLLSYGRSYWRTLVWNVQKKMWTWTSPWLHSVQLTECSKWTKNYTRLDKTDIYHALPDLRDLLVGSHTQMYSHMYTLASTHTELSTCRHMGRHAQGHISVHTKGSKQTQWTCLMAEMAVASENTFNFSALKFFFSQ